jgi:hypothetical protein
MNSVMAAALHARCRCSRRASREQDEQRPQPLASAVHDVVRHLVDERHVAVQLVADLVVDAFEVLAHDGTKRLELGVRLGSAGRLGNAHRGAGSESGVD